MDVECVLRDVDSDRSPNAAFDAAVRPPSSTPIPPFPRELCKRLAGPKHRSYKTGSFPAKHRGLHGSLGCIVAHLKPTFGDVSCKRLPADPTVAEHVPGTRQRAALVVDRGCGLQWQTRRRPVPRPPVRPGRGLMMHVKEVATGMDPAGNFDQRSVTGWCRRFVEFGNAALAICWLASLSRLLV